MFKKILLLSLALLFAFPAFVFAQSDPQAGKIVVLPRGEVVDHDYFAAGQSVEVSGTVNGDVYAAGGQVLVDGNINGDLLVAGGTVTVSGQINGDLRAAGGQVLITGTVDRNISVAAGSVEFTDSAVVGGNVAAGAGSMIINSPINGDINAGVGNLRLSGNAQIGGDINYASEEEVSVSQTASVSGTISRTQTPQYEPPSEEAVAGFLTGIDLFTKLASFITSLVIGLLMLKFLPNYTTNAAKITSNRFLPSLGIGFVGLVVVPVLAVVLFMSILGIPLALLLIVGFMLYLYVVRIFAMVAIGQKLAEWLKTKTNIYWVFIIGLVAYYVLTLIPIIGWVVKVLVLIASFGAALVNEKTTWQKASKAKIV